MVGVGRISIVWRCGEGRTKEEEGEGGEERQREEKKEPGRERERKKKRETERDCFVTVLFLTRIICAEYIINSRF